MAEQNSRAQEFDPKDVDKIVEYMVKLQAPVGLWEVKSSRELRVPVVNDVNIARDCVAQFCNFSKSTIVVHPEKVKEVVRSL